MYRNSSAGFALSLALNFLPRSADVVGSRLIAADDLGSLWNRRVAFLKIDEIQLETMLMMMNTELTISEILFIVGLSFS